MGNKFSMALRNLSTHIVDDFAVVLHSKHKLKTEILTT